MILVILHIATFMLMDKTRSVPADLQITIKNIKETRGHLMVGLFDNEESFPKTAAVGQVVAVTADSALVVFSDLRSASYAISVVHDANSNGKLDTNFLGIPKEGFAFGNNAMGAFGPPSFKSAQIRIDTLPVKQVLVLKYF
jgi:uncharacterized protein (DUF2141 family)